MSDQHLVIVYPDEKIKIRSGLTSEKISFRTIKNQKILLLFRPLGWGLSDDNTKRHESIPLLSNAKILNETYCYTNQQFLATHVTELSLCAGVETGSPNKGDSGGGLFYLNGTTWIQYGIISASLTGDAEPSSFTLYTNTTAYTNWTESIVGQTGTTVMTKDNRINRPTELWCYYDVLPVKR